MLLPHELWALQGFPHEQFHHAAGLKNMSALVGESVAGPIMAVALGGFYLNPYGSWWKQA